MIRTTIFVIILLFASGWLNGDRLREVGEKTQLPVWERMATVVDKAQSGKSRVIGGARNVAREKITALKAGIARHSKAESKDDERREEDKTDE